MEEKKNHFKKGEVMQDVYMESHDQVADHDIDSPEHLQDMKVDG